MLSKIFCGNKKIFLIFAVLFLNLLLVSPVLAAAPNTNYVPLINVPGVDPNSGVLTYLSGLYNFLISVVGILAMAVIIYGGMRYLTSAGNPSSVEEAKDAITSAVTGLILALVSWLILSTINPDILVLKSVGVSGAGTYSYSAGQNSCVANATGTGTAANQCLCVDGKPTYTNVTVGPTVTGTSISPCSTSVPTATSTITITFSEALDPASISSSTIQFYSATASEGTVTTALTSPNVVTISWTGTLAANTPKEIIVTTGVKSAKGVAMNAATCSAVDGTPPAATTAYDLRFTTNSSFAGSADCVSCSVGGSNPCQQICSDPKLSYDNAYHCLKADLRVGNAPNPIGKEVTVKVGEAVFFDARTYSADYKYSGLNTGVSSDSPNFDNGIDRYEMCYDADNWASCNAVVTSYGCSDGASCSWVLHVVGWLGTHTLGWMPCGIDRTSYSSAGTYRVKLWARNKNGCIEATDEVVVHVNP